MRLADRLVVYRQPTCRHRCRRPPRPWPPAVLRPGARGNGGHDFYSAAADDAYGSLGQDLSDAVGGRPPGSKLGGAFASGSALLRPRAGVPASPKSGLLATRLRWSQKVR
jgi:hypothetical protein